MGSIISFLVELFKNNEPKKILIDNCYTSDSDSESNDSYKSDSENIDNKEKYLILESSESDNEDEIC